MCRASRARRVEPVELVMSSESSCAVHKMHGLDTSNVSSRVESSQVEFELKPNPNPNPQ